MKSYLLAAILLPAACPAFAQIAATPAGNEAPVGMFEGKQKLLNEMEAWRSLHLPHLTPPDQTTVRFEPRLDEIKASVMCAAAEAGIVKPRKDFEAWKTDLLKHKYTDARAHGLSKETLARFTKDENQVAAFSAALHMRLAQDASERALAATQSRTIGALQNPSYFFDGKNLRGASVAGDPAVVWATPPPDGTFDASRYVKVRQILVSQGASARVVDMAIQEAIRQHADPLMVLSVINAESGFDTHATSYRRDKHGHLILDANGNKIPMARGLMQIMADTGKGLGVHDKNMLYDAQTNLNAGIRFLKGLFGRFAGGQMTGVASQGVKSAVAAYNAGPGAVDKYDGVPPYRETQGYVKKVLAYYATLQQHLNA